MSINSQSALTRWFIREPTISTPIVPIPIETAEKPTTNQEPEIIEIDGDCKNKKRKWFGRKVSENWKNKYTWLVSDEVIGQRKKCNLCSIPIAGGQFHIERHANSNQHKKIEEDMRQSISIKTYTGINKESKISQSAKKLEISLSMFIAEHNLPFSSLDHLNKCLQNNVPDSKIVKKMCINRKKGQNIIKKITGPANSTEISKIVNNQYYSIIIDESTDCIMLKNLAIIIRIFTRTVKDRFLGLVEIEDTTSQGIFDVLLKFLKEKNIPLKNMIGFTSDNCNVMMGKINGVQAKLKEVVPKLFVNGCICHNLNLISIASAKELPESIDKFIREINHHFCHSPSRKAEFNKFQDAFGTELHVILRYAPTRWLSRQAVIDRILEQWIPLTYYFTINDFETDYGNENISFITNCLKNPAFKLYFLFLSYILKIINSVNLEMQSEEPRMHIFLPRLKFLFNQICRNFMQKKYLDSISIKLCNFNSNQLADSEIFCGIETEKYIKSHVIDEIVIKKFFVDVRNFYIKFCIKLREKINFENEILNVLPKFAPLHVLSGETNSVYNLLLNMFPENEIQNAEKINNEYRALADYAELKKFQQLNISDFWYEISQVKNELNEKLFTNIFRIAQGILSLPHSSANVERIFSFQNLIKTKCRNRLAINTCDALIQTKDLIKSQKCCCFDFDISKEMINQNISDEPAETELLND